MPPTLRLVSSSSDSSIPRSSAKRFSKRWKSPGMLSRAPQFDTRVIPTPSKSESFFGPPKAEMISDADRIIQLSTLRGRMQGLNTHIVEGCGNTLRDIGWGQAKHVPMGVLPPPEYDGRKAFERLARLLRQRKNIDVLAPGRRDGSSKAAAVLLELKETTFNNWKQSRGLPAQQVPHCAYLLDADPNYLLGLTDDPGEYNPTQSRQRADMVDHRLDQIERTLADVVRALGSVAPPTDRKDVG